MSYTEIALLKLNELCGDGAVKIFSEFLDSIQKDLSTNVDEIDARIVKGKGIISSLSVPQAKKDYNYYSSLETRLYRSELILWYFYVTGNILNLDCPQTFSEKSQWLKLYDSTPLKTQLADKYLVRDWVRDKIGEKYLVPLLGVWDSFDEITFSELPTKFVLKTNHGSGWNQIVEDKNTLNISQSRKNFNRWLNTDYSFCSGFEMHYHNIKPRIIAEKYLCSTRDLYDYRFMCFNGKVEFLWINNSRYAGRTRDFRYPDWEQTPFWIMDPGVRHLPDMEQPEEFEEMLKIAEKLSDGFPFVRVDLYHIPSKKAIYFSEMTFISENGVAKWNSEEYDLMIGKKITLPQV